MCYYYLSLACILLVQTYLDLYWMGVHVDNITNYYPHHNLGYGVALYEYEFLSNFGSIRDFVLKLNAVCELRIPQLCVIVIIIKL